MADMALSLTCLIYMIHIFLSLILVKICSKMLTLSFSFSSQVTFVNRELVNRGAVRWIEVLWNQSSFSVIWIYTGVDGWWDFVAISNTALSSTTTFTGLLACYLLADAAGYNHYHHHGYKNKAKKKKIKARDFKETS